MLTIFSDPHVGLQRNSHTTNESKSRLNQAVFDHAIRAALKPNAICLGDLFDKESNSETTILQGLQIAQQCELVLAGNHDLPNREGKLSSLQLVNEAMGEASSVLIADLSEPTVIRGSVDGVNLTIIPHQATQQLFDAAIEDCCTEVIPGLVLLHANYDNGLASDDASLNLSKVQAEALLEHYEYVLSGHEHNSSYHLGGRLVMVGCSYPTSFSDISDKYIYTYDQTAGLTKELSWSKSDRHATIVVTDDMEFTGDMDWVEFLEVDGRISPEKGPELAEFVQAIWEAHPGLMMVRNNVTYTTDVMLAEASEGTKIHDLPQQISEDLSNTDLKPLWDKYRKAD